MERPRADRVSGARGPRRTMLATAALLALAALSACGGSSTSHTSATVASLTTVAYATDRQPGYAFHMVFSVDGAGQHSAFTGSGRFDARTRQGTVVENVAGHRISGVFERRYLYLRVPRPTAATGGKEWIRLDVAVENPSLGQDAGSTSDPASTLGYLRHMGHVTVLGPATLDGRATTRYHGFVDLQRVTAAASAALRPAYQHEAKLFKRLTGATTFPVDAWVDRRGLVRQLSFHVPVCTRAGRFTVSTTLQIMRYGRQPIVHIPPPSQYADLTGRLRAQNAAAARAAC